MFRSAFQLVVRQPARRVMDKDNTQSDARRDDSSSLRALPAVHRVIAELGDLKLPRPLVVQEVRDYLERLRVTAFQSRAALPDLGDVVEAVRNELDAVARTRLCPVVNATGIIIHTNLGRSPLSEGAVEAVANAARDYVNLEYDLQHGNRGGRGTYVERALALLCGAEACCVVNNCAAALVLILRHSSALPPRTHVVISRGELVQIGGGFRVPDILEASGATLREVGTTNKTTLDDYAGAIDQDTSLILRVHRSNFFMGGFVESPDSRELARIARQKCVPFVEDLGSGALFDTSILGGNEREPTPQRALQDGADLVTFSGDKLLGGPQAGIIAGSGQYVGELKREPFFRALRCDKLALAALEATVDSLLEENSVEIPIRRMMEEPRSYLVERAERIVEALGSGSGAVVGHGTAQVGGGSLPKTVIPSVTVDLSSKDPHVLASRLRAASPPVIGYVADGAVKLDLRTVFPHQDAHLTSAVRSALAK